MELLLAFQSSQKSDFSIYCEYLREITEYLWFYGREVKSILMVTLMEHSGKWATAVRCGGAA
jgi:hypothetical protein